MATTPFPLISELPVILEADDWAWSSFAPSSHSKGFWLGTDRQGVRWLLKISGSFYAHREHVFASLAQRIGLSCQSSVYVKLHPSSEPLHSARSAEHWQLAIWFLPEHAPEPCHSTCPIPTLFTDLNNPMMDQSASILRSSIPCIDHWPKGEMLADLCAANLIGDAATFVALAISRAIGPLLALIERPQVIEKILTHLGPWAAPAPGRPESIPV